MNIGVTGAAGFIGSRLVERLRSQGHSVRTISVRTPPRSEDLAGCQAVVHLAGEPVAQRWTAEARRRILDSREQGTRALVAALRPHPPNVLISASGVGYYGSRGDDLLTEREPPGTDFLSQVSVAWEREAMAAEDFGVRVVRLRIGMVVGPGGGAVAKMLLPFRLGLGGRMGGGRQWLSWIHREDLCDLILFALRESTLRGVWNATSPHPVPNAEFARALARAVRRPAIIPVPAFALKLMFGEMAETILGSQRAIPEAAVRAGFEFQHPEIGAALAQTIADERP